MLLLDTTAVPSADHVDAFRAAMGQASVPCRIDHLEPDGIRARMHLWAFGGSDLFTADVSGFRLTRTPRHVRMEAPPVVALAVQAHGQGRFTQFGRDQLVGPRDLMLSDLTAPYAFSWTGGGGSRAFQTTYDQLGLPGRRGAPGQRPAGRQPAARPRPGASAPVGPGWPASSRPTRGRRPWGRRRRNWSAHCSPRPPRTSGSAEPALADTLLTRVMAYVRAHLTDPSLSPQSIARAHSVSVRQLYKVCAAAELSLEQWIIDQRLEAARTALVSPDGRRRSIAATAHAAASGTPATSPAGSGPPTG